MYIDYELPDYWVAGKQMEYDSTGDYDMNKDLDITI